jgi:hypothetical protein
MNDNIVQLFPERTIKKTAAVGWSEQVPTTVVTPDDILSAIHYDFRGEWDRAVDRMARMAINPATILGHEVSLNEIGTGIAIAKYLSRDEMAVSSLKGILINALELGYDTKRLIDFEPDYRGYVWTLDYQTLLNASAFVRLRLESIIGRPVERHTLFDH